MQLAFSAPASEGGAYNAFALLGAVCDGLLNLGSFGSQAAPGGATATPGAWGQHHVHSPYTAPCRQSLLAWRPLHTMNRYYHGTRTQFSPGDSITPDDASAAGPFPEENAYVLLAPDLDEAIWSAELALGDGPPRVYLVEALGDLTRASNVPGYSGPAHPCMSWCSRGALSVVAEVTEWLHYHGTRADLRPGDLIEPGFTSNFGASPRAANYAYFARTLDAAVWGAELAKGAGPSRIYVVEPTGAIEDDPNLTNQRFRGNPTKSFRSRAPLRLTGEIKDWKGHPPEAIDAMKEGVARLEQAGVQADD